MALEQVAPELLTVPKPGSAPIQTAVVPADALDNPLFSMSAADIADWSVASKGKFSPVQFYAANRELVGGRADIREKLSDAHSILGDRGFVLKDIDAGEAVKGLGHMVKGLAVSAAAFGEHAAEKNPLVGIVSAPAVVAKEIVQAKSDKRDRPVMEGTILAADKLFPGGLVRKLFKQDTPEQKAAVEEFFKSADEDRLRREAETIAGTEAAATGLGDLSRKGFRKVFGKDWDKLTPEERDTRFELDASIAQQQGEIAKGKGAVTGAVFGEGGPELDPKRVGLRAAGDPLSFAAFAGITEAVPGVIGQVVKATPAARRIAAAQAAGAQATRATGAAAAAEGTAASAAERAALAASEASVAGTPEALSAAQQASNRALMGQIQANTARGVATEAVGAAQKAGQVVGESVSSRALLGAKNAIGKLKQLGGAATSAAEERVAQGVTGAGIATAGGVTAGTGAVMQGALAFLAPIITPRALKVVASGLRSIGGKVAKTGSKIFLGKPEELGLVGQFVNDLSVGAGRTVGGAARGFVTMDLPLAALTSEQPADTAHMPLFMTAMGGLGGGLRGARGVLSGQIVAPRTQRMTGTEFGSVGRRQYGTHTALDQGNQFSLRGKDPRVVQRLGAIRTVVEQFGGEAYFIEDPQVMQAALRSAGYGAQEAAFMSQQLGVKLEMPNARGELRPVIIMRELSSGPHEAGHAMQFFLSEEANNVLRQGAMDQFSAQWDRLGEQYVNRLVGSEGVASGRSWQEILAERTGNPRGRDVVELANERLADEIIAENFDAIMEARGPELEQSTFQQIIHGTLMALGAGDSIIGQSKEQGIPVTPRSLEAVRAAAGVASDASARPRFAGQGEPLITGPARRRVRVESREEAATTPTEPQVTPRAPESPAADPAVEAQATVDLLAKLPGRESSATHARSIADAIKGGEAVSIAYRAAPGESAGAPGSNRSQRRAVVEAFRRMPESARSLWERTFFPERLTSSPRGVAQVIGWSPEVLAANAQKMAEALANMAHRGVDIKKLSPYEVDLNTGSFTEAGWNQLFQDAQIFSQNQQYGHTGGGATLVVPRSAREAGAFAPEVTGQSTPLPERTADFHNLLFNFKLPKTPRITRGKTPLNILGQEVSEATQPGRVSVPVEPRAPFAGEQAKALGIEGREIREVNPLRAEIEREAKVHGLKYPSMIEVVQRLNIDRIADVQGVEGQAPVARGNTLTLSAGFQPRRAGRAEAQQLKSAKEDAALESNFAKDYLAGKKSLEEFPFHDSYEKTIDAEAAAMGDPKRIMFVGSGPVPLSPIMLARKFPNARVDVLDIDAPSLRTGEAVAKKAGVEFGEATVADGSKPLKLDNYDAVVVALEAGPTSSSKSDVVRSVLKAAPKDATVLLRSSVGDGFSQVSADSLGGREISQRIPTFDGYGETLVVGGGNESRQARGTAPSDAGFRAFQARSSRGSKKWALKKPEAGNRMVKAWIMPDGEPVQLGGQWHHDYLAQNAKRVGEQFRIDPRKLKGGETASRAALLQKNGVRVNYNHGTGHLTLEATEKGWQRNKAAIETFVLENIDKIDNAEVNLFNDKVSKLVDSEEAALFRFDGPEKLQRFPLLFEDARSTGSVRDRIGGVFQPAKPGEAREHVTAAAIRWKPTGELFKGAMHSLATDAALAKGIADKLLGQKIRSFDELGDGALWSKFMENVDDGFQTNRRPFINRDEAVQVARAAKQLDNRGEAKVRLRQERIGDTRLDSGDVPSLRDAAVKEEGTIGRAHPDPTIQAQPANEFVAKLERARDEPVGTGFTDRALALGKEMTADDRPAVEAMRDYFDTVYAEAKGKKDFNAMMEAGSKRQFFNEILSAKERKSNTEIFKQASKMSDAVRDVVEGKSDGVTLDAKGNVLTKYDGKPFDVVTLNSRNVPLRQLARTLDDVRTGEWSPVLAEPDTAVGAFRMGRDLASVDVNAIVPKSNRENTAQFLKENDQVAGFDLENFETFDTGGTGKNPKVTTPEQAVRAIKALQEGKPFDFQAQPAKSSGDLFLDDTFWEDVAKHLEKRSPEKPEKPRILVEKRGQ